MKKPRVSNDTHESTTDPESRLMGMGHALVENRHGLLVDLPVSLATGDAERAAALEMLDAADHAARFTVGAERGYDTRDFIHDGRDIGATPHVAQHQNRRRSAIDDRTTRHPGDSLRPRIRKRIEQVC